MAFCTLYKIYGDARRKPPLAKLAKDHHNERTKNFKIKR